MDQAKSSPANALPARPNLDYLKKLAKERLRSLRATERATTLADAQLAVAREYGFTSWRALKAGVDSINDDNAVAALFETIDAGDTGAVAELLRHRPELARARDLRGRSPLHAAAETNAADIIDLLVAAGADAQAVYGGSAHTPLSWALTCMASDAAHALVAGGVKPDLFCAAGMGAIDMVKSFFDDQGQLIAGASRTGSSRYDGEGKPLPRPPSIPREIVSDALYIAARNGNAAVVRFLLTRKPDLSFRAFAGGTALHWAYFGSSRDVVSMLLDAGADRDNRDNDLACTPRAFGICMAANSGIARLVYKSLKDDPTLVNINEGRGTPLHEAARGGHGQVIKLLLINGGDPSLRDIEGKTAAERAKDAGHHELAKLME